ncbi:MAG: hypothetical protein HC853_14935, partial [Anaerolineae bacterium]|nr:hypothetical protein [Anaerolineae bacterium]
MSILPDLLTRLSHVSVSPLVLGCALMAAAGALVFVSSVGLLSTRTIGRSTSGKVRLGVTRAVGDSADRETPTLLRLFTPLAESLMQRTAQSERDWVEQAYDLLDRHKGSADFYAKKVICALTGFGIGLTFGAIAAASGTLLPVLLFPLVLSLLGFWLPTWELRGDLARRREQLLFELPFVLDTLSVNVLAKNSIVQGLNATVQVPNGGYLIRELLQVALDYQKSKRLRESLERMATR